MWRWCVVGISLCIFVYIHLPHYNITLNVCCVLVSCFVPHIEVVIAMKTSLVFVCAFAVQCGISHVVTVASHPLAPHFKANIPTFIFRRSYTISSADICTEVKNEKPERIKYYLKLYCAVREPLT